MPLVNQVWTPPPTLSLGAFADVVDAPPSFLSSYIIGHTHVVDPCPTGTNQSLLAQVVTGMVVGVTGFLTLRSASEGSAARGMHVRRPPRYLFS